MTVFIDILISIAALLVTLGILVTFHEFGHFWVARRCGVKVERFSIGFGKPLYRWGKGETEYVIAALPLGGYVKMLGEQDHDIPAHEKHRAFNNKSLGVRAAIVAAGPLANFLLAVIFYWIMYITGVSGIAPVVGSVDEESPAAQSGLMSGDEIIRVDNKDTDTWQEVRLAMLNRLGESGTLNLTVRQWQDGQPRGVNIPIESWLSNTGEPDILNSLGITPYRLDIPARIGELVEGGRAEAAGLQVGDLVVAVNGRELDGWFDWVDTIRANPENDLLITVERDGTRQVLTLRPAAQETEDGGTRGYIGAAVQQPEEMPTLPPEMNREVSYSVLAAVPRALGETWDNTVFVLASIKKMLVGLISVQNLSGPITIAQVAGETATYGFEYYISFLAILSISLGVLNLLPIPVLDGGHLFYYMIEFVIRRPIPERVQQMGMQLGLLLIVGIMFIAFYNDINRLF